MAQTGTPRCSVTPRPVAPSVPNEMLSSINIRTLYWCFSSTCTQQSHNNNDEFSHQSVSDKIKTC